VKSRDSNDLSRREFLAAAGAVTTSFRIKDSHAQEQAPALARREPSILNPDYRKLVSAADLVYDKPVARSEEGIPVGNGRMGSLVWTTEDAIKLQVNRVDVYGNDSSTNSFFEREGFKQRLSLYDGVLELMGKGVSARVIAWPAHDVIAIEVEDQRRVPEPISVSLRMLRHASQYFGQELEKFATEHTVAVQTRNHRAESQLIVRGDRIVLKQEFKEGKYLNRSAVAIAVIGRPARAKFVDEVELRLTSRPSRSRLTVLISSAASFNPSDDVVEDALKQLDAAGQKRFSQLARETSDWWKDFWSRGFVQLHSSDGSANFVQQNYYYFLYLMAASSRGKLPPKFNGMIWNTGGDLRTWGNQHWFANLSCYYEAIPTTNRLELLDPALDMYFGMYEQCALAARQQWGSEGIFIPEVVFFDGLAQLPDDIAAEMRDLYLLKKPWSERSARFLEYSSTKHPHSSRWNWIGGGTWTDGRWVPVERGSGPYGPVTHILGTTAKVAFLFWRRYEYTLDREWLQRRAYPMLKGAAEFYRNYPNLRKGDDGKYHIHDVNSNESVWGARDTDEDLASLHALLPVAIRAAEILEMDKELRGRWRELLASLPALSTSEHPDALKRADYQGPIVFVRGLKPAVMSNSPLLPDANSLPMWFFDLCHIESADKKMLETARATFATYFRNGINAETPVSVLSKLAIAASALGRSDAVVHLIPNQIRVLRRERETAYRGGGVLANRMTLREGPQALDAQRLGRAAEALHQALLQSAPPSPGSRPIIRVFPAWPDKWDASFKLLARGAFLVASSIREGRVSFVQLESKKGAECSVRSPWGEAAVTVYRDGRKAETLNGSLLTFETRTDETVVLVPPGQTLESLRRLTVALDQTR
jgi:hypothetical protein